MFTQFEIPVAHLPSPEVAPGAHFVPPRALDPNEIARRQGRKPGQLIAEQQLAGIQIAADTLEQLENPTDIKFMASSFALAAFNTAWYLYGQEADMEVMRRHVDLPFLVGPTAELRPNSSQVLGRAISELRYAADQAHAVERALHYGSPRVHEFRPRAGRQLGSAALNLGVVDLGDKLAGSPRVRDSKVQQIVRARSTRGTRAARTAVTEIGQFPSLAALAEPLSAFRVFIGRNAPSQEALDIFNQAVESNRLDA